METITEHGRQLDFRAPTTFDIWSVDHAEPRPKLAAAWQTVGPNLWHAMAAEPRWWASNQARCIWASCSAAAYLNRLGLRAEVVSAVLHVIVVDGAGTVTVPTLTLGEPDPVRGDEGTHNVVLVSDGRRQWILETSVWQAHRPRFGALPDLILAELPAPPQEGMTMFRELFASFGAEFLVAHSDSRGNGGGIGLAWGLMRKRPWKDAPDARPERAKAVVRTLEAIKSGRLRQ